MKYAFLSIGVFFIIITYNFIVFSLETEDKKVIKTCSELRNLLVIRKNTMSDNLQNRLQVISDVEASLGQSEQIKNSSNKNKVEIEKLIRESNRLILEKEDLIEKSENLLNLNCDLDKLLFKKRLGIFNSNVKNHLRKEKNLVEDFENLLKKVQEN